MKTTVIFGYSDVGKKLYEELMVKERNIVFCDNKKEKQGKYGNIEVLSVEEAVKRYGNNNVEYIIASVYLYKEMIEQLRTLGINDEKIRTDLPEEASKASEEFYRKRSRTIRKKLVVEINIARHCNLNCRSCDHFSPLSQESFADLGEVERDFRRLLELFGNKGIEEIRILGGEPLLNKQINEYFYLLRNLFPEAKIFIITNGILLVSMENDFWDAAKRNNIIISVTKYPIKLDYDKLIEMAKIKDVEFEFFGNSSTGRTFWHTPLDFEGKQDPIYSFEHCRMSNWCIQLDRGKLYTCTLAATIDIFNEYYGRRLELTDRDVIDIYAESSADDILRKLAEPMSFCRYCGVRDRTYGHPWAISMRDIKEWSY